MEMTFQKRILTIAVIGLIVLLVVIGISMSKSSSSIVWPPIIGSCPDYWLDLKGDGAECQNVKDLGSNTCSKTMDFTQPMYSGEDGLCNKYKWANTCGVTWDGITYGVKNPCDNSAEEPPPV